MAKNIIKNSYTKIKTRTKLIILFIVMICVLVMSNLQITRQIQKSNAYIEKQGLILANQTILSDTISCFGEIKYWVAFINNRNTSSDDSLSEDAEETMGCEIFDFENHVSQLKTFDTVNAQKITKNFTDLRTILLTAVLGGAEDNGPDYLKPAFVSITAIDATLDHIKAKLNKESSATIAQVTSQSEYLQNFPVFILLIGLAFIGLIASVIFFSIFQPIDRITSTMVDASKDPQNTRDYIIYDERDDEVGEVMSALNSLLLQVSLGISRLKDAEREIAATARKLDSVFNSVADGLVTVNEFGEIETLNKNAYAIFGYRKNHIEGKRFIDLLPADFSRTYTEGLRNYLNSGNTKLVGAEPTEITGHRSDGTDFPMEISVSHIPLDDGTPLFVNVIRDVTYRKELERQLLHAQKMEALGSLSSGIAHEINTPTQYVGDNLKFLEEAFEGYEALLEAYQKIQDVKADGLDQFKEDMTKTEEEVDIEFFQEEAPMAVKQSLEGVERISEIVGAVKGFSYPATDEKIHVNLNEAIQNTIVVSRNQWKNWSTLSTELDDNLPLVPCIPGKLTQVILNLIINAAHALEEKGAHANENNIHVRTFFNDDNAFIAIKDNGPGIPKNIINKIFDPFFTTKEVGKGTGQGLSISYDIINNKHQGSLTVDSEVDEGTCFTIRLPLALDTAPATITNNSETSDQNEV